MATEQTTAAVAVLGAALICATFVGVGAGTVQTQPTSQGESITLTHSLEVSLTSVPADGSTQTVHVTMADEMAGDVTLQSVSASAGSVSASGRLVDGADDDGVEETIAVDVTAEGGGEAATTLALEVVGTYPDAYNESVEPVRVTAGNARFAVDTDDPLVETGLGETTLTGPTVANALFGISTPDGVAVDAASLSLDGEVVPQGPQSVPLKRVPPIDQDGVEVTGNHDQMEMHADVPNATAGQSISMAVEPTTDAGVALDSISLTPANSGPVTLDVVRAAEPMDGFPELDTTGKEPLAYIDVQHSIDNANISEAAMTVRVSKTEIDARETVSRDEVALYRHDEGGWSEVETHYLGETPSYYVYRVVSTGFSEWATAGKTAAFRITATDLNVTSEAIEVDDSVRVTVEISNEGEADGEYETELILNDVTVERKTVSIAADGTSQVNFERRLQRATTYEVAVNDVVVDEIRVRSAGDGDDSGSDGGLPTVPIAAGILGVLVVLGLASLVRRE